MATRRTTKKRIEVEVRQNEARNRRQFRQIQRWARETQRQMEGIAAAARRIAIGIGGFFAAAISLYAKQEIAERKLRGALRLTGQEVDRLSAAYKDLASEIQGTTTFGDEDLLGAAATLTRLAQISEEQMPQILRLTADWAAFLDQDVNSAARMIGRVMADPLKNLSQLSRYGVSVSEALKKQVETLIEAGRIEEARLILWEKLHGVVGGAAAELANVETGKWIQLKNTIGDIFELVGERLIERLKPVREFFTRLAGAVAENRDGVRDLTDWLVRGLMGAITAIVASRLIAWIALVVKGLYAMRIGASRTAAAARLMWGAFTLGLAFAVPFIIENWDKVVATFHATLDAIKGWWTRLLGRIQRGIAQLVNAGAAMLDSVGAEQWAQSLRERVSDWAQDPDEDFEGPAASDGTVSGMRDWWGEVRRIWQDDGGDELDPDAFAGEGDDLAGGDRTVGSRVLGTPTDDDLRDLASAMEQGLERQREYQERQAELRRQAEARERADVQRHQSLLQRIESASGASRMGIARKVSAFKAKLEKALALYEMAISLAKEPSEAFARTYAHFGWPYGAIFGAVAQAATYASLIAGIASIRGMQQGGVVGGGVPGRDSVLTALEPGELVGPRGNFDEIVGAVAASRDNDLSGEGELSVLRSDVIFDEQVLGEIVVEFSKRNRAFA